MAKDFEQLLAEAMPESTMAELAVDDIFISINENIRDESSYVQEEIAELAANIEAVGGLLQPVGVAKCKPSEDTEGKSLALIYGFRRMLAIQDLAAKYPDDPRWKTVRCQVYTVHSIGMLKVLQLAENANRKQLNPMETAKTLQLIVKSDAGMSQEKAAKVLGISPSNASQMLKLLTLPQEIQDDISSGKIPFSSARKIVYEVPEKHWSEAAAIARQYAYLVFAKKIDQMYGSTPKDGEAEGDSDTPGPKQAKMIRSSVIVSRYLPYLKAKAEKASTEPKFSEKQVIQARIESLEAVLLTENNPLNTEIKPFMEAEDQKEAAAKEAEKDTKAKEKFIRAQVKAALEILTDTSNISDPNAKRPTQAEAIGAVAAKVAAMSDEDLKKLDFKLDTKEKDFVKTFSDAILKDWKEMDEEKKERAKKREEAEAKKKAEEDAKKATEAAKTPAPAQA